MRWRHACLALFLASAGSAAAGTLGLPNEIANGGFETGGWTPWTQSSLGLFNQGQDDVPINTAGGQTWAGLILYRNGNYDGPSGTLRQVVDESQFPGWEPKGTRKLIDIEFDYLLHSVSSGAERKVGLLVQLDWQADGSTWPVPGDPSYQRQLVFEEWRYPDAGAPQWKHADIRLELPFQPRFLGVEFEFHLHFPEAGVVGVDNVDLEGQCLPEPSTLASLIPAAIRVGRRRSRR